MFAMPDASFVTMICDKKSPIPSVHGRSAAGFTNYATLSPYIGTRIIRRAAGSVALERKPAFHEVATIRREPGV
jgi:hypothetical protein